LAPETDPAARWLAELRAHPTHHDLLAAFDLLQKTTCHLSESTGEPNHLSESTGEPNHLSESTGEPNHLSESTGDRPPREPVRFTHSTDLALPLGELLAVTPHPQDPPPPHHTTPRTGPCGPASPLPLALADDLADDPLALAVLDLFHHRRTLLLCRGLLAADLAGTLDTRSPADPWSRRITALVGLTTSSLTPLEALRLAPLLASADRSPRALALALRRLLPALCPEPHDHTATTRRHDHADPTRRHDHADPPTLRCELAGDAWTALADEHHSRLGGPAARLGDTAALGTALRLPSAAARLHLGPLPASALSALRPGNPLHAQLCALLAIFIPDPLTLDLIVELDDLSLPPCRLGQQTLGHDLFLTPDPAAHRPHRLTIPLTPA